jgi:putative ABC transport system substrate-binding protein
VIEPCVYKIEGRSPLARVRSPRPLNVAFGRQSASGRTVVRSTIISLATLLSLLLLAAPVAVKAQQGTKITRVGLLRLGSPPDPYVDAFRQGLHDLGYVEGQTIGLEYRWAQGDPARLSLLAAELVQLKVDIILTQGEAATRAVKQATDTIPIVMATSGDPVGAGLIASLARPGGNVTGLTSVAPDLSARRLQLLKQAVPKVSRVAILYNPTTVGDVLVVREAQTAARTLGVTVYPLEVRSSDELAPAFEVMTRDRVDALSFFGTPFIIAHQGRILNLAERWRLPTTCDWLEPANCLMNYGPNRLDMFRRAATYIDRILKGARPADLAVEQPTKFELVINLKTAKALGLTIPASVLAQASRVTE